MTRKFMFMLKIQVQAEGFESPIPPVYMTFEKMHEVEQFRL